MIACMSETTIRVPKDLRNRIKDGAAAHGETQADFLRRALAELEQAEFLAAVAGDEMTADERAEFEQWEQAPVGPVIPE